MRDTGTIQGPANPVIRATRQYRLILLSPLLDLADIIVIRVYAIGVDPRATGRDDGTGHAGKKAFNLLILNKKKE